MGKKLIQHHLIPRHLEIDRFLGDEAQETIELSVEEHRKRHKEINRLLLESGYYQILEVETYNEKGQVQIIRIPLHREGFLAMAFEWRRSKSQK